MKTLKAFWLGKPAQILRLLVVLMAAMVALAPSAAADWLYTYSSSNFTDFPGSLPATPAIDSSFSFSFIYPGDPPLNGFVNAPPCTLSSGALQFSATDGQHTQGSRIWFTNGVLDHWDINLALLSGTSGWQMYSGFGGLPSLGYDDIAYCDSNGNVIGSALAYKPGVWSRSFVPLPPTALLLGSGLIPLAWFRARKRWRK